MVECITFVLKYIFFLHIGVFYFVYFNKAGSFKSLLTHSYIGKYVEYSLSLIVWILFTQIMLHDAL